MSVVEGSHNSEELAMQTVTTIGLDIAKWCFRSTALMLPARWSSGVS